MKTNLKAIFGNTLIDEPMCCNNCGEEISYHNTRTKEGQDEFQISGVCEKCFDNSTFNLEENLNILNQDILSLIKGGVILAGGALRSLVDYCDEIMDYDLFVLDSNLISQLQSDITKKGFKKVFECPKGELFTFVSVDNIKVQIINKRTYYSMEDLISSFDITACCCAYDGTNFCYNERFVFDNLNKLININKVEYPNATLRRIAKYVKKGFKLSQRGCSDFTTAVNQMVLTEQNSEFYID